MLPLSPPLAPSPDEGRSLLRRELLEPRYQTQDPIGAALDWLERTIERGLTTAGQTPALSTAVAMLLLVALLAAVAVLASRARRTPRSIRRRGAVLDRPHASAAGLRAAAEQALATGSHETALLQGFRALARRQVETGAMVDDPGATAREVAAWLGDRREGAADPSTRERLRQCADRFDAVLYGGGTASADEAREVLDLDDRLAGALR